MTPPAQEAGARAALPGPTWLRALALDGIAASCEAVFPHVDQGTPDWQTTRMVERMVEYLGLLPSGQRALLTGLFVAVELASCMLTLPPRRFSRLPTARRTQIVARWRASSLPPLRALGDAVKATTTVIFISHPSVLRHMGAHSSCEHLGDGLDLEVRPRALPVLSGVTAGGGPTNGA